MLRANSPITQRGNQGLKKEKQLSRVKQSVWQHQDLSSGPLFCLAEFGTVRCILHLTQVWSLT